MSKQTLLLNKKVSSFREVNGLNDKEPINLHALLLKLNVFTIFKPLSENFSGMAFKLNNSKSILINSNHSIGRQNFTICHEFYHLFVQDSFSPHRCNTATFERGDTEEYNADSFASKLLMPDDGILDLIPDDELGKNKIQISTILKLEQIFGVSHLALLYRLKELEVVDQKFIDVNKSNIINLAASYGYDTAIYKPGNENKIIGNYGAFANKAFQDEKISEGHFNELMDIFDYGEE
jgi:Zn-dependent peptidase ImmA (M78 family)